MSATTTEELVIRRLTAAEIRDRAHELADILMDAVDAGASISFAPPIRPLDAIAWTLDVADRTGRWRIVFGAELDGRLVGTVQLLRATMPNQPHRANVAKLLVHRQVRRRGIGRALMGALEATARDIGITLLTLDAAVDGQGPGLYQALGWTSVGIIPGHTVGADGVPVDTHLFYKQIA